jgi:hypothetical protein
MYRKLLPLILGLVLISGAAWSASSYRGQQPETNGAGPRPWTAQPFNNANDTFRFAVVSDRTGGHRTEIFSKAVSLLNLMQPEFVLSVGDLIEGYSEKEPSVRKMWSEFDIYVKQLQMPFFHVPGNHDVSNNTQVSVWKSKFGKIYYHFVYKNVLFLCLNTEDFPEGQKAATRISPEQTEYFGRILAENRNVRWTIVALHKPVWTSANPDDIGWTAFEKQLLDRPYTVFAGHVHHYQKFVRHGRNYYQLATTGGSSKMRGLKYGEFDHITWVTMKPEGPVLANVLLSGVLPEDLGAIQPVAEEKGVTYKNRRVCHPGYGRVLLDGRPVENAEVVFHYLVPPEEQPKVDNKKILRSSDGVSDAGGHFLLSTYTLGDGVPVGEFIVTVVPFRSRTGQPVAAPTLPVRYKTVDSSPLRVRTRAGQNEITIELQSN